MSQNINKRFMFILKNQIKKHDRRRGVYENSGISIVPMMGDRADILSQNEYKDGVWTLEIMRALKTEGENADSQDVQFADKSKSYPFGIAVFIYRKTILVEIFRLPLLRHQ